MGRFWWDDRKVVLRRRGKEAPALDCSTWWAGGICVQLGWKVSGTL